MQRSQSPFVLCLINLDKSSHPRMVSSSPRIMSPSSFVFLVPTQSSFTSTLVIVKLIKTQLFDPLSTNSLYRVYWAQIPFTFGPSPNCGAEEFGNPDPFHIKLKAHAEEKEISEEEQRMSKLPGDVAEENPILSKLRSRKEKAAHHQGQSPRASQGKAQVQ